MREEEKEAERKRQREREKERLDEYTREVPAEVTYRFMGKNRNGVMEQSDGAERQRSRLERRSRGLAGGVESLTNV